MAVDWIDAGIGIVGGGALGTAVSYFIAPKAQRDQNQLAREVFESDKSKPLRERQIAVIERALEALDDAQQLVVQSPSFEVDDLIEQALAISLRLTSCVGGLHAVVADHELASDVVYATKALNAWSGMQDLAQRDAATPDEIAHLRSLFNKQSIEAITNLGYKLSSL